MSHRIHGVMRLVAMNGPVAFVDRLEFIGPHCAHRYVDRHFRPARFRPRPAAVRARHFKIITMHVNGMVGHGQIAYPDADFVVFADDQRVDAGEHPAVPAPEIKVRHCHDFWHVGAGSYVVGVEQKHKIAVNAHEGWVFGMHDEHSHHAHRHLHHFIGVRMIHKRTALHEIKLVDKRHAGFDLGMREAAYAIHAGR